MACDVLILGAFHPELAPLRPLLGDAMRARVGGANVVARVVGIGLTMAAVGSAMQLVEHAPGIVVLVGTCGVYRAAGGDPAGDIAIGDVAVPARLRLSAPCVVDGLAQFPDPMSVSLDAHAPTVEGFLRAGGKPGDVATTPGVTVDDSAASRVARATGARVEHLEAHGVATACAARGVPFAAALGVANEVGSRAREQWRAHHRAAAAASIAVVARWLQASWHG
jgi:nucleoside phosphorylase